MVQIQLITSLIVLALIGLIDSLYLSWKHLKKQPLVCPITTHDCQAVVESKYGKLFFGIKNEYLGSLFYLAVIIAAIIIALDSFNILLYLLLASAAALIISAYLFYVQAKILKNYCTYCIISALVNLLIFLNVLLLSR